MTVDLVKYACVLLLSCPLVVLATLKKPQPLILHGELQQLRNADAIFHERFNTKVSP